MKSNIVYFFLVIVVPVLWNCSGPGPKEENSPSQMSKVASDKRGDKIRIRKSDFENKELTLTSFRKQMFGNGINVTGMLDVPPDGRAVISAQIGGYVKESKLLVGDRVKKGQLLLSIENIEFLELQQQFLEASENLKYLKSDFERQEKLFSEKITSEKSYLKAERDYRKTMAVKNGLEKKLQLLEIDPKRVLNGDMTAVSRIYSPISGDVTQIHIKTGMYISPADEIMEIVNTDHMHIELNVYEKDVLNIKKDQPVYFYLPETGARQYHGDIHLIGKSINEDRTVKVHAHIDENEDEGFIPGMFVQAKIITDQEQGVALKKEAVFEKDFDPYVLKLQSENDDVYVFERISIQTGKTVGNGIQVINQPAFEPDNQFLSGSMNVINEISANGL